MDGLLVRKCIVEFIGTFFLVFVIGCVSSQRHVLLGPLAIGATLMVMIFAGGHISGGHYNPAVTLGAWIRGACTRVEAGSYVVAQVIGAVVASLAVPELFGHAGVTAITASPMQIMVAEFLGTFALVYTVLNVATAPATAGNSFYGLAIGFTVFVQAVAVGAISGGAFNPAVVVGAFLMGGLTAASLWMYWLSQLIAAAIAAGVFRLLHPERPLPNREQARNQAAQTV
jgi:aquaporin Z